MGVRLTLAFSCFAAPNDARLSSYCTVSVIVVEFDSGAYVPVTVSV